MAANVPPPSGETPLDDSYQKNLVKTGPTERGGGTIHQEAAAFRDFQNMFGRNPTQSELSLLSNTYAGDPNYTNDGAGKAQVAAYFQQQVNTPQKIYQTQQDQYAADAPKFSDQVASTFQSALGRAPTDAEQKYFGSLMASGQDQYQVQQALQQTQEYQNTQNTNFQNKLQGQLQQSNSTYFNQYIAPSIQSSAALAGRSQDSSGVNSQLANAALQQNQGLQGFLAQTTANNYQNSTANATNQYSQLMGQQYGLQNAGVSNQLSNQAANQQYNQNLNMYQAQQQAYNTYLNRYGKTSGWGGVVAGGASGAAAGTSVLPGWGTLIGGVVGAVGGGVAANNSAGGAKW